MGNASSIPITSLCGKFFATERQTRASPHPISKKDSHFCSVRISRSLCISLFRVGTHGARETPAYTIGSASHNNIHPNIVSVFKKYFLYYTKKRCLHKKILLKRAGFFAIVCRYDRLLLVSNLRSPIFY